MADLSPFNPLVLTYTNATSTITVTNITLPSLTSQTHSLRLFAVFTGTSALNVFDPALEKNTHLETYINLVVSACPPVLIPSTQKQMYTIDLNKEDQELMIFNFGPFLFNVCDDPAGFTYTALLSNDDLLDDSLVWNTSLSFDPLTNDWKLKSNDSSLEGTHTLKLKAVSSLGTHSYLF